MRSRSCVLFCWSFTNSGQTFRVLCKVSASFFHTWTQDEFVSTTGNREVSVQIWSIIFLLTHFPWLVVCVSITRSFTYKLLKSCSLTLCHTEYILQFLVFRLKVWFFKTRRWNFFYFQMAIITMADTGTIGEWGRVDNITVIAGAAKF